MRGPHPKLLSRLLASIALPALDDHFTRSCHWHLAVGLAQLGRGQRTQDRPRRHCRRAAPGRLLPDRQIGR